MSPKQTIHEEDEGRLSGDLVVGAEAIGRETNLTPRQVHYLTKIGALPVFRLGKRRLAARRSQLRARMKAPDSDS